MKLGNYIQVKKGIKDHDYLKYDLSGFKGVITEVMPANSPDDETIITVKWDIETLKMLSKEFIASSVEEGMFFDTMNLVDEDLIVLAEVCKDDEKERENLVLQLEGDSDTTYMDEDDKLYLSILGKDIEVNAKNLAKYRSYLIKNLDTPLMLTGREDFSWEERFVFGYGSEEEYEELRKTNPSYNDTFALIKILDADISDRDLIAKVKRKSDKKQFELGLSWLECTDKQTDDHGVIELFASWIVNY